MPSTNLVVYVVDCGGAHLGVYETVEAAHAAAAPVMAISHVPGYTVTAYKSGRKITKEDGSVQYGYDKQRGT